MSDKRNITKFENLPNEIFINCFEYLNAPDIFNAFEQLNPRFYRLIRTIPLRLNFEDISKSIFDRFCEKMLDYTEIQKQIYSLKLSNENTHGQIHAFFTYFSLVEFTQLRSLVLIEIKENNLEELSSVLPLLSQLTCLRLVRFYMTSDALISKLPKCRPNILSTSSLNYTLSSFQEIIPLTKLSVKFGMLNQYYQLLVDMPFLQYLNISRGLQFESVSSADISLLRGRVNHLKHLIVTDCMADTNNLMDVIAHMINLRSLTVSAYENSDIINASRWQYLITSSLPCLNTFRFKFGTFDRNEIMKYEEFQNDFWIVEHQWYTECLLAEGIPSYIFTVPYLIDTRSMWFKCVRYCNTSVDNSKTFDDVTDLYAPGGEELIKSTDFYFPNIRSLFIHSLLVLANEDDEQKFITSLKRTMNLSNLKHLEIPICFGATRSTIILKILKEAPHLSSLNLYNCAIDILKTNKETCRYTSKMIKKLQFSIYSHPHSCDKSYDMSSIHEVFPNIEEITCSVRTPDACLLLLRTLPKLSKLTVTFLHSKDMSAFDAVKQELSKFKNIFFYEDIVFRKEHVANITFGFWVDRDS